MRAIRLISRNNTSSGGAAGTIAFPTLFQLESLGGNVYQKDPGFDGGTGLSNKKIAAGTDGLVYWQFATGTSHTLFFNLQNANEGYEEGIAGVYTNGTELRYTSGAFSSASLSNGSYTIPNGHRPGIRRVSGQLQLVTSPDGATWTVRHEFATDSSADLFIQVYLQTSGTVQVFGENLVDA